MQHIYFQCQICEKSVFWKTSAIGVPIGKGMLCPHCMSHYVLELRLLKSSNTVTTNFQPTLNERNTMPIKTKLKTLASGMICSTDKEGIQKIDPNKVFILLAFAFYWIASFSIVASVCLWFSLADAFLTFGCFSGFFGIFLLSIREEFDK